MTQQDALFSDIEDEIEEEVPTDSMQAAPPAQGAAASPPAPDTLEPTVEDFPSVGEDDAEEEGVGIEEKQACVATPDAPGAIQAAVAGSVCAGASAQAQMPSAVSAASSVALPAGGSVDSLVSSEDSALEHGTAAVSGTKAVTAVAVGESAGPAAAPSNVPAFQAATPAEDHHGDEDEALTDFSEDADLVEVCRCHGCSC